MVAALRSGTGASRFLLRSAFRRRVGATLLATMPLLVEYEAVVTRKPAESEGSRSTS